MEPSDTVADLNKIAEKELSAQGEVESLSALSGGYWDGE